MTPDKIPNLDPGDHIGSQGSSPETQADLDRLYAAWDIIAQKTGQHKDVDQLHRMFCIEYSMYDSHVSAIFQDVKPDQMEVLDAMIEVLQNPKEFVEIKTALVPWLKQFGVSAQKAIPVLRKIVQEQDRYSDADQRTLWALLDRAIKMEFTVATWPALREQIEKSTEALRQKSLGQIAAQFLKEIT
jgi:hypothetical protein